jgi:hypothetical protein
MVFDFDHFILVNFTINVLTIKCSKRFLGRTCEDIGGHKRKKQPNIEINTLYDFFKDLNTKGLDEQQSTTLQNELPNDSNVHINGYISQNEIFKCIKNLKNNKACGEDVKKAISPYSVKGFFDFKI